MKSFVSDKRWKYLVNSPAVVSSEISIYRPFADAPNPGPFYPEMKQANAIITSAIKTSVVPNKNVIKSFWLFNSVKSLILSNFFGFRCRVSGVRLPKLMTCGFSDFAFCHLFADT